MRIHVEDVHIIEYYDGLVRGVVRTSINDYFAVLVEWEIATGRRVFVLLEMNKNEVEILQGIYPWPSRLEEQEPSDMEELWNRFENNYEGFISRYGGPVYLFRGEVARGEAEIALVEFEPYLAKLRNYDMENIIV